MFNGRRFVTRRREFIRQFSGLWSSCFLHDVSHTSTYGNIHVERVRRRTTNRQSGSMEGFFFSGSNVRVKTCTLQRITRDTISRMENANIVIWQNSLRRTLYWWKPELGLNLGLTEFASFTVVQVFPDN